MSVDGFGPMQRRVEQASVAELVAILRGIDRAEIELAAQAAALRERRRMILELVQTRVSAMVSEHVKRK